MEKLTILGTTYLDHAGTTLYPKSLIDAFSADMMSSLFGNPHSASASSQLSTRRIDDVRLRVLRLFNANPRHFDLVFTANATAGIKLVVDSFREEEDGFWYGYHKDSHTSLVGARECARAGQHCFDSDEEVETWLDDEADKKAIDTGRPVRLFAYPAQSNMNGRRLPLSWTGRLRAVSGKSSAYSLLDAAAMVSTSPLDLQDAPMAPDFTVLSFNKMFGFPDLGALIVRKESAAILRKRKYFGGGTVEMVTTGRENWHIRKQHASHDHLEDGTLPVHSIVALANALDVHSRLFGSFGLVAAHTNFLAKHLHDRLAALRHENNTKVCHMYHGSSSFGNVNAQGPVVAFNICSSNGSWVSTAEVEKLASIKNIQIRTGGLCNPGGVASFLNLQPWETKRNYSTGYRCGNEDDVMETKPTGMIRLSLGAMSNMQDVDNVVAFVREFFVDRQGICGRLKAPGDPRFHVESLTIFPIKSCGGWAIPSGVSWEVRDEGLAWDREWCLVHQGTHVALSQKRYPKMALLKPSFDLKNGLLHVRFQGPIPPRTPVEISIPLSADPNVFLASDQGLEQDCSEVCGDSILVWTYAAREIMLFFTNLIGTPCTLARFPASASGLSQRHTKLFFNSNRDPSTSIPRRTILLPNESPILIISRSSLNRLNEQIKMKGGKAAHASVFRANIIVAEDPPSGFRGETPYCEDRWRSLIIGNKAHFDVLGGCRRCQMVSVDQQSAEKNEEPFVTLATTRRIEGKVMFGVHTALMDHRKGQAVRIQTGDQVTVIVGGP